MAFFLKKNNIAYYNIDEGILSKKIPCQGLNLGKVII